MVSEIDSPVKKVSGSSVSIFGKDFFFLSLFLYGSCNLFGNGIEHQTVDIPVEKSGWLCHKTTL